MGKTTTPLYRAYRKIRFLWRNGSFFSVPERNNPTHAAVPFSVFRIISANSLFLFLLAYLAVYVLNLLIVGVAAIISHIPVIIYYYGVEYIIRGKDWTPDAINIVFSSGPLIMLILSVIFVIIYLSVVTETGMLRLFLLWVLFHSLTRSLGEILVGAVMNEGFGFVILYMFIMDTGKLILTISTFVGMFTIGLFFARYALFSANIYFNELRQSYQKRFIANQFLYPFLVGNLIIFLVKLPGINIFDISLNVSQLLFLIPIFIAGSGIEDLYFDEEPRQVKIKMILPLIVIGAFLLFRLLFGIGIRLTAV